MNKERLNAINLVILKLKVLSKEIEGKTGKELMKDLIDEKLGWVLDHQKGWGRVTRFEMIVLCLIISQSGHTVNIIRKWKIE